MEPILKVSFGLIEDKVVQSSVAVASLLWLTYRQDCIHSCRVNMHKVCEGMFAFMCVCACTTLLGLESLLAGMVGRHLRRFPAAELQNPSPQSLSSALISSYRHGACGQRLPGFQTLSSATVTAGLRRSEVSAEWDLLSRFAQTGSDQRSHCTCISALHVTSGTKAFWLTMKGEIFQDIF